MEQPDTVPVGRLCMWCRERILYGDRGSIAARVKDPHWTRRLVRIGSFGLIRPRKKVARGALHAECYVRLTYGSVSHQTQQCTCARPGHWFFWLRSRPVWPDEFPQQPPLSSCKPVVEKYSGTRREEAREVCGIINHRRAEAGLRPFEEADTLVDVDDFQIGRHHIRRLSPW